MKKIVLGLIIFITIISWKKHEKIIVPTDSELASFFKNETAKKWLKYYQSRDKNFKVSDFIFINEQGLNRTKGTIYAVFDKEFDKIYLPYLIYSPNKKIYLDIDSYNWEEYIENGKKEKGFEVDNAVCLVNLEVKRIEQIAFYGSSNWVEDAFWVNDSTVVLLENGYDKKPRISVINITKNKMKIFELNYKLRFNSDYTKKRLKMD